MLLDVLRDIRSHLQRVPDDGDLGINVDTRESVMLSCSEQILSCEQDERPQPSTAWICQLCASALGSEDITIFTAEEALTHLGW